MRAMCVKRNVMCEQLFARFVYPDKTDGLPCNLVFPKLIFEIIILLSWWNSEKLNK